MGNCFSGDVHAKGPAGLTRLNSQDSQRGRDAAEAVALLTGSAAYSSWLEVQVACANLPDRDAFSKSDPMAVLYELDKSAGPTAQGTWRELGRTEVVSNNLSPTFVKRFRVQYNFEKVTELMVRVTDVDVTKVDPTHCDVMKAGDYLGDAAFKLNELVTARDKRLTVKMQATRGKTSTLTAICEEVSNAREVLTFSLAGRNLMNKEVFSKSDPFVEISRANETGGWLPCYKTEVVSNNLNPFWKPITIKAIQLNNGDPYRPLRLRVLDYENSGAHRELGVVETNAIRLQEAAASNATLDLQPAGKAGMLAVSNFSVIVQPTFLDYIQAGVEIGFMVAIDFTGSNGDPRDPRSLHYFPPGGGGGVTPYEEAILGVGRVLEFYDSDRTFQCFGFGGMAPGQPVSHCFPLGTTGDGSVQGIDGILQAYRLGLSQYGLAGPTLFTPTIRMASQVASQPTAHIRYTVLLILTDGAIMDMQDTVDSIIAASGLPLSILIVGIGNEDFSSMKALDADDARLASHGKKAERDIVQFVEFRRFANAGEALAAELLAELPGQFLAWTRAKNVPLPQPRPPGQ